MFRNRVVSIMNSDQKEQRSYIDNGELKTTKNDNKFYAKTQRVKDQRELIIINLVKFVRNQKIIITY